MTAMKCSLNSHCKNFLKLQANGFDHESPVTVKIYFIQCFIYIYEEKSMMRQAPVAACWVIIIILNLNSFYDIKLLHIILLYYSMCTSLYVSIQAKYQLHDDVWRLRLFTDYPFIRRLLVYIKHPLTYLTKQKKNI